MKGMCMSLLLLLLPLGHSAKVLVTTGYNHQNGSVSTSEIVDLTSGPICGPIADYPLKVKGAVGFVLSGTPTVCGGFDASSREFIDTCFQYERSTNTWLPFATLDKHRYASASVPISGDEIWITGGTSYDGDVDQVDGLVPGYIETTEILSSDGTTRPGIDLPMGSHSHCMVQVEDYVYLFGGEVTYSSRANYRIALSDLESGSWEALEDMDYKRYGHTCHVYRDERGQAAIVVVGGDGYGTSETLNVEHLQWTPGPNILRPLFYAQSVTYLNTFFLLGGSGYSFTYWADILEYQPQSWVPRGNLSLETLRREFVAISVPDDYCVGK
eukprot:maker-scaffold1129_size60621-snap-gene-0.11 protein:Tk11841 transcript:maker-scaffold1129_size60621-snap-gene-0.11-mRNA-1 annotation:"kelch domain protein"